MANEFTVKLSPTAYNRIVEELTNAKNAVEYWANDEGADCNNPKFEGHEEWKEICEVLQELKA